MILSVACNCASSVACTVSCLRTSYSARLRSSVSTLDPYHLTISPLAFLNASFWCHIQRYDRQVVRIRSEEHTSELQSHLNLLSRLLLEKTQISSHLSLP